MILCTMLSVSPILKVCGSPCIKDEKHVNILMWVHCGIKYSFGVFGIVFVHSGKFSWGNNEEYIDWFECAEFTM